MPWSIKGPFEMNINFLYHEYKWLLQFLLVGLHLSLCHKILSPTLISPVILIYIYRLLHVSTLSIVDKYFFWFNFRCSLTVYFPSHRLGTIPLRRDCVVKARSFLSTIIKTFPKMQDFVWCILNKCKNSNIRNLIMQIRKAMWGNFTF